ncbi:MAG TPA: hypothetical protein VL400_13770 [Polyangiaceae bacterium]|nr:hypothetical protein [Polyangiaceae bacterium]
MSPATSAAVGSAEPSVVRIPAPTPRVLPPAVRFVDSAERDRVSSDAERARAIVLRPPALISGELGRAIDADLESALAVRGAMPAATAQDAEYEDVVSDQLLRAAALPVRGFCLALPMLPRDADGMIADADAKALAIWIDAARRERRFRLVVLLDAMDRSLSVRVPRSLESWIEARGASAFGASRVAAPSEPPASQTRQIDVTEGLDDEDLKADGAETAGETSNASEDADDGDADDAGDDDGVALATAIASEITRAEDDGAVAAPHAPTLRPPSVPAEELAAIEAEAEAALQEAEEEAEERARAMRQAEEEAEERARATRLVDAATWRSYAVELEEARGPRPVSIIEKLFATRYVPLVGAIARGETDASVRTITELWRQSFAESYEAAYGSLRVTGKRPTMVMDAPEVAHRIARLASARSVKLVMIDSMGFDLGERVSARVGAALEKRAALVEKNVLWAALPATTPTQLHLLARGAEGLKDPQGPPPSQPDVSRGRAVATFRRERLGSREILKLDVVEARLRTQGASYDERLDAIAEEVSDLLVKLFDSLPPRTLAYVFGDHGFVLPHGSNGWPTGAAAQGGATPEEVLVGGHAWLIDAVQ